MMLFAILALAVGVLVYLLDRPLERIYFIPDGISITDNPYHLFGELGNYLPTLLHTYAFILLTSVVLGQGLLKTLFVCTFWLFTEMFFEVAQSENITSQILPYVPEWFNGIPFLENTAAYFQFSTFDELDVFSIALGTVLAYLTILLSNDREVTHVLQKDNN